MSGEDDQNGLPSPGDSYPGIPIEGELIVPQVPQKPLKDRLTVVSRIYHQRVGKNPKSIECKFSRLIEHGQQLYEREMEATEEWQPLDCGWVADVGMLVIINQEGQNLQVHPTDEEREATAKKILDLCYAVDVHHGIDDAFWSILPDEFFCGSPRDAKSLYIRSQSGIAEYTLYLIPR